jgi:hypothetical protein
MTLDERFVWHVDGRQREYRLVALNGIPAIVGYAASVAGLDLSGADLSDCDLSFMNFDNANLICATLRNANLRHASFCGADCSLADFRGADLRAVRTDENTEWMRADLRGAQYDKKGSERITGRFLCDDLPPEYLAFLGLDGGEVPSSRGREFVGTAGPGEMTNLRGPSEYPSWAIGQRGATINSEAVSGTPAGERANVASAHFEETSVSEHAFRVIGEYRSDCEFIDGEDGPRPYRDESMDASMPLTVTNTREFSVDGAGVLPGIRGAR